MQPSTEHGMMTMSMRTRGNDDERNVLQSAVYVFDILVSERAKA